MRHEGPFVLEWLSWLRLMGVWKVLIYSNDCADHSDDLLDALDAAGVVTHVRQGPRPPGRSVQWTALKAAWKHPLRGQADWAMGLDFDEVPVPLDGARLVDVLADLGHVDGVALPWRLFGTSGHIDLPDGLLTGALTRAAPVPLAYPASGSFVKSAFRLSGPFDGFGVHRPKQLADARPRWVGPDLKPLGAAFDAHPARINLLGHPGGRIQLNHYALRSAESFLIKRDRGLPNRKEASLDLGYWVGRNFNSETDVSMAPWQDALGAEIGSLRALPNVAALEAQSVAWHRARVRHLLRDPATLALFGQLLMANGSSVPPAALAKRIIAAEAQSYLARRKADG
jgi:hypothetical protein